MAWQELIKDDKAEDPRVRRPRKDLFMEQRDVEREKEAKEGRRRKKPKTDGATEGGAINVDEKKEEKKGKAKTLELKLRATVESKDVVHRVLVPRDGQLNASFRNLLARASLWDMKKVEDMMVNVTVNGHLVADPADIVLEAEDKLEMPTYRRYRHSLGIWTDDDDDDEDEEEASSSGDGGDKVASPHKSKASPSKSKDKSKQKPRHPDSIPNTPPCDPCQQRAKDKTKTGPCLGKPCLPCRMRGKSGDASSMCNLKSPKVWDEEEDPPARVAITEVVQFPVGSHVWGMAKLACGGMGEWKGTIRQVATLQTGVSYQVQWREDGSKNKLRAAHLRLCSPKQWEEKEEWRPLAERDDMPKAGPKSSKGKTPRPKLSKQGKKTAQTSKDEKVVEEDDDDDEEESDEEEEDEEETEEEK